MSGRIFVVLAMGLAAGGLGVAPVSARERPALGLVTLSPVTVHGSGFRAGERVRVRLRAPDESTRTRRIRATRRGAFTTVFAGAVVDRCSGFMVTAVGRSGRRAWLYRPALECPAA